MLESAFYRLAICKMMRTTAKILTFCKMMLKVITVLITLIRYILFNFNNRNCIYIIPLSMMKMVKYKTLQC